MAPLRGRVLPRHALVLACLLLFGLLARQVLSDGTLARFDRELVLFLVAHRSAWLTRAMLLVSELHNTLAVLGATAVAAAGFAWRRHGAWVVTLCAVPFGMLLNVGLKHVFERARPPSGQALVHLSTFSFPSGHAVASTLLYGVFCMLLFAHARSAAARIAGIMACVAMIGLVCFSRMYLAAHFLSDVLAGICVAVAWLLLWTEATARLARSRRSPDA